ncbi:MAG: flagellar hook capping FlgD N-terminal domain-containing protein [Pseudomonadota bacterium]
MTTPIGQPIADVTQSTLDQLNTPSVLSGEGGAASLGQADFLRLLTESLLNQDPLEPLSNEDMIAQLAQFSSLEAETDSSETLTEISDKLDALIASQEAALAAAEAAAAAAESAAESAAQSAVGEGTDSAAGNNANATEPTT